MPFTKPDREKNRTKEEEAFEIEAAAYDENDSPRLSFADNQMIETEQLLPNGDLRKAP